MMFEGQLAGNRLGGVDAKPGKPTLGSPVDTMIPPASLGKG